VAQAKGTSVVNLINLQADERLQTILTMNDKEVEDKYIALATKNGLVKKTKLADYQNIRTNGIIAIILKDCDELVWGKVTQANHIMLITHEVNRSVSRIEIKVTARHARRPRHHARQVITS
jgi:DNA gyrase subunit A